ncbi:Serine hydroxymethyltransferase [Aquisphaera giovannonii]|uniref:Serine hydroxymethyltransferase n=1 Tax=Aquisphaera giovannonii TaxID=406548 RepID=A0A5B9W2D0_9BACT|nr:glycine hydroxymethyltransferase [Aquisphaera giovannonii]QEH34404.1 Serine hydroxymethyltransferase [Aquisphaera giovannonii]
MHASSIRSYLGRKPAAEVAPGFLAYLANLDTVAAVAPDVARAVVQELADQRRNIKLIASENYSSLATQCAMGNLLTDKYAEGIPHHRFYAGCDNVDSVEDMANARARELFGAAHAYSQPHSGADANLVAFWAILRARVELPAMAKVLGAEDPEKLAPADWQKMPIAQWNEVRHALGNQRLLGMDLASGGHLTHGYRLNASGKMFEAHGYTVDRESLLLDYDAIEKQALEVKPLILLAGFSAYPRNINYRRMREIADKVGAVLMVDMAHFSGLVAGKVLKGEENPIEYADVVTTTTHKTLRGPRGGLVLCTEAFKEHVDRGCPLVLGGPLPHVMAAKAVAFTEALRPEFAAYAAKIVDNSRALAEAFLKQGLKVISGGTDNHLVLVDVGSALGITGRQAEEAVRRCGITLNRNPIPFDPNGPWYTSGLRFGTPAVTTLGMGPAEMAEIASVVADVLRAITPGTNKSGGRDKAKYTLDEAVEKKAHARIKALLDSFPVYPELDLPFLLEHFGAK